MLLDASVQVAVARSDVEEARAAAAELEAIASAVGTPAARAIAAAARGAVLLAEGDAHGALAPLREAWMEWQRLDAPYDAARVRRLIGMAYGALGDQHSAAMEFDAARWAFQELGAIPDLVSLDAPLTREAAELPGNLTAREADVLRLLASGQTNREIGVALVISEHTVARHVQNMLAKLGRSSRAALAAFAVEHGIASPGTGQK
jgi:DNA-binding CsgD family transcriptional regulator